MKKQLLALGFALLLSAPIARAGDITYVQPLTVYRLLGFRYELTGRDLNGTSLNGEPLDGHGVVSVSFDGAVLGKQALPYVGLDGSELEASRGHGHTLSGADLVGAVFEGTLETGTTLPLRIESVRTGTDKWDRDVNRYAVTYETSEGWRPLCGVDSDGTMNLAIALEGSWDYGQGATGGSHRDDPSVFTFACEGHALAKCVEMGYKPWQRVMECTHAEGCRKGTLAAAHQTCTRMLRADYCGDGTSYTVEGTEVNAYDVFGVRTDALPWTLEAEWGPDGATCVARERLLDGPIPPCMNELARASCGAAGQLGAGTLIVSEIHR
jgi:hypothetical protein